MSKAEGHVVGQRNRKPIKVVAGHEYSLSTDGLCFGVCSGDDGGQLVLHLRSRFNAEISDDTVSVDGEFLSAKELAQVVDRRDGLGTCRRGTAAKKCDKNRFCCGPGGSLANGGWQIASTRALRDHGRRLSWLAGAQVASCPAFQRSLRKRQRGASAAYRHPD